MHRTKRRLRLASLLATAVWLGGGTSAWAVAPRIAVTPNENHPSTTAQVNGAAFGANEAVDIYFDTTDEALAVTNGAGNFPKTPTPVPASALPGAHYVTAVGRHSGLAAQVVFTVNTDWAQFHFNEKHRGLNAWENVLAPSNVSSLDVAWTYTTGGPVDSSPAVVGGNVYVCSADSYLYSINAATGALNWRVNGGGGCSNSPPAVANGIVYIGSSTGDLQALFTSNGSQVCSYQVADGDAIDAAPTVVDSIVYFASEDGYLFAMDANDCGIIWSSYINTFITSSPAVANGMVFIGSVDGNFYGLDAYTGVQDWVFTDTYAIESSPAVSNGEVYFTDFSNTLYAFSAKSGRLQYRSNIQLGSSPAVANGVVYVGTQNNGEVAALDAVTLSTVWIFSNASELPFFSSPAVANGVIYIADAGGEMYALSAATGSQLWISTTGSVIRSSPAVSNGMVYVGSEDDNVYAYALNGGNDRVYKNKRNAPAIHSLHPNWSLNPYQSENTAQHTENAD